GRRLELRRRGSRAALRRDCLLSRGPVAIGQAARLQRRPAAALRRRPIRMSINITMPALSPTMEEGTLAKWHVKEGDSVSSGDVIAEIETDKATMEVEAVDEGTIGKIVVPEGTEGVKVNAVIAVILTEGESADDIKVEAAPAAKA